MEFKDMKWDEDGYFVDEFGARWAETDDNSIVCIDPDKLPKALELPDPEVDPRIQIDSIGRRRHPVQNARHYPGEIQARARLLIVELNFDYKKVADKIKDEFGLFTAPTIQTVMRWAAQFRHELIEKGIMPLALRRHYEILKNEKSEERSVIKAVEMTYERVDGKPIQPTVSVVQRYDMSTVLETTEPKKQKTPPGEWLPEDQSEKRS
jgi:hypothetical protein